MNRVWLILGVAAGVASLSGPGEITGLWQAAGAPSPDGFPQIRSWDGTTLKVDWDGLRYQATCKSSTAWNPTWPRVTYPACERPSEWGVWWGRNDLQGTGLQPGDTLSLRWRVKAAGGQWVERQENFVITSVKAIGPATSPLP
jgi:hypothetical protein